MEKKFADMLPDLSKPQHISEEVNANRKAAFQSGALQYHYFPLTAPDQQTWTALLERVAMLENQMETLTLQMLETALWIQHQRGHEPIFLYDLINIGHDTGLLTKDGTLAE